MSIEISKVKLFTDSCLESCQISLRLYVFSASLCPGKSFDFFQVSIHRQMKSSNKFPREVFVEEGLTTLNNPLDWQVKDSSEGTGEDGDTQ